MSQVVHFEFLESPVGKQRAMPCLNKGKIKMVTRKKTRSYEESLRFFVYKLMVKNKWKKFEAHVPLEVDMVAYFDIPKSTSKSNRQKMLSGKCLPTKKPDTDNIQKIVFDALNKIVYHDDAQICKVSFIKVYDTEPRVKMSIKQWEREQD